MKMLKENRYEQPSQVRRGIKLHYQSLVPHQDSQNRSHNISEYRPYVLNKNDISKFASKTNTTPVKHQKIKQITEGPVYESYIEKIMKHNDEKLKKVKDQYMQEKMTLTQKIRSLERENDSLKAKIQQISQQKEKQSKTLKMLQEKLKQLQNQKHNHEQTILNPQRESLKELAQIKRHKRELKKENGHLHTTIFDLTQQVQKIKTELQNKNSLELITRLTQSNKPTIKQSTIIDIKQSHKDRKYIHHLQKQLYDQGFFIGQRDKTIQNLNEKIVQNQLNNLNNKYKWMFQ